MVRYQDTLFKIMSYLQGVARKPFYFNNTLYTPKKYFYISSKFFRGYTCPENCGGCCHKFTLVYFKHNIEKFKKNYLNYNSRLKSVIFTIDGKRKEIYQLDNNLRQDDVCSYLGDKKRCTLHLENPLSCRFELKKISIDKKHNRSILTKKLFGRGWALNSPIGALCKMTPFDFRQYEEDIRDLQELKIIADDFEIKHNLDRVLEFLNKLKPKLTKKLVPKDELLLLAINN